MRFIASTVVASFLLIAGGSQAQTPKDAQSSYEPRSKPGSGQKYLERFAGDWDVSKVFYPRTGEPVRLSGQCRQTMIQGGRFLQSEFVFGEGEKKSTGLGIIGFEPDSGRFTSFWVDSRQTRMSARQSRDPFDGEKIVLFNLVLEPGGNETRKSRTVSQLDQSGRKLLHRQYALGTSGEERLVMELIMTRKP